MFGHGIEGLIIKYSLGICFVAVFVVFGVKMLFLLSAVAKLKLVGLLEGHELIQTIVEKLLERGAVK